MEAILFDSFLIFIHFCVSSHFVIGICWLHLYVVDEICESNRRFNQYFVSFSPETYLLINSTCRDVTKKKVDSHMEALNDLRYLQEETRWY